MYGKGLNINLFVYDSKVVLEGVYGTVVWAVEHRTLQIMASTTLLAHRTFNITLLNMLTFAVQMRYLIKIKYFHKLHLNGWHGNNL